VLLVKVPPRPKTDGDKLRAELEHVGFPVFKAEIPLLTAFDRAYTGGVLVRDVKRDPYALPAWEAYAAAGKESSMADSKFAGLRAVRQPLPVEMEQPSLPPPAIAEAQPVRGRGRPAGKRSNPDWKLYSHF
jgi:hypothetical protein